MPSTVQRGASSLLAMINNYQGQTPRLLLDELRGVVDLVQFYGVDTRTVRQTANAALTAGNEVTLTVPGNERWLVYCASASVAAAAAMTALQFALVMRDRTGLGVVVSTQRITSFPLAASDELNEPWIPPYTFLLGPGESLRTKLVTLTGVANASVAISALVSVLG